MLMCCYFICKDNGHSWITQGYRGLFIFYKSNFLAAGLKVPVAVGWVQWSVLVLCRAGWGIFL